jgi:hypothetical protein
MHPEAKLKQFWHPGSSTLARPLVLWCLESCAAVFDLTLEILDTISVQRISLSGP